MKRIKTLSIINTVINGIEFLLPFVGAIIYFVIAAIKADTAIEGSSQQLSSVIHAFMGFAYIIPSLLFVAPTVSGIKVNVKSKRDSFPDEYSHINAFYRDARTKVVIDSIVCFFAGISFLAMLEFGFHLVEVFIILIPAAFLYLSIWQQREAGNILKNYKEAVV